MVNYITVVCPHCGKEVARLRLGESQPSASDSQPDPTEEVKLQPISALNLNTRTYNCLKYADIMTIGDLIQRTELEIFRLKNMGRVTLKNLCLVLANMNLSFARYPRLRRWNEQTKTYDIIPNEYGASED